MEIIKANNTRDFQCNLLCQNCKIVNYKKSLKIKTTGKLLLLQMNIFGYSPAGSTKHRVFLTLKKKTIYKINEKSYKVIGVVLHYGDSLDGGHYITRVLFDNKIITCNDEHTKEHLSSDFCQSLETPYLILLAECDEFEEKKKKIEQKKISNRKSSSFSNIVAKRVQEITLSDDDENEKTTANKFTAPEATTVATLETTTSDGQGNKR